MRDLCINITVYKGLIVILVILGLIIITRLGYNLFKKFIFKPNYPEICEYQKRFMKEEEFEKVRADIFKEFDDATLDELNDLETKVNIEIEDINKGSTIYSIITMVTFILGVCINAITSNKVEKTKEFIEDTTNETTKQLITEYGLEFFIVLIVLFILISSIVIFYRESKKYNKYLVFLKELIKRYKDPNNYKEKNK